jgi:hypothetical protein
MAVFIDQWVRTGGHAKFHLSFVFNRKRYILQKMLIEWKNVLVILDHWWPDLSCMRANLKCSELCLDHIPNNNSKNLDFIKTICEVHSQWREIISINTSENTCIPLFLQNFLLSECHNLSGEKGKYRCPINDPCELVELDGDLWMY